MAKANRLALGIVGRGERGPSIGRTPPKGTKLAEYVDFLGNLLPRLTPAWRSAALPLERRQASANRLLAGDRPLHELEAELVREHLLIPALKRLGMPEGTNGEWYDLLLDSCVAAEMADSAAAEQAANRKRYIGLGALGVPGKRGGHPRPKYEVLMVVLGAWWGSVSGCLQARAADPRDRSVRPAGAFSRLDPPRAHNWDCEAAARRLTRAGHSGSRITRDQVRRIVDQALSDCRVLGNGHLERLLHHAQWMADVFAAYDRGEGDELLRGNSPTETRYYSATAA